MKREELGQGITEVVFAIGITILALTAGVALLINSIGASNRSFDRKKAADMAGVVMEGLVSQSKNNPTDFWNLVVVADGQIGGYEGYVYDLSYDTVDCINSTKCAEALVVVKWTRDIATTLAVSRYFAR